MAWTYDLDFTTTRDQVRLLIGDTDTTDQLIQDEEITFLASENGSVYAQAAACARAIAGKYARQADKQVGDLAIKASARSRQYAALAEELDSRSSRAGIQPYAGGLSISERSSVEEDTDRTEPFFTRALHSVQLEQLSTESSAG